jgi:glycosyltransferase involved in cell wall biosynthesis
MRISFICCPFKTSFGAYGSALKSAIEAKTGEPVQWVAANCGCGDPMEARRQFLAKDCDYFDFPIPNEYRSKTAWKRRVRGAARSAITYIRARKFDSRLIDPEVVHFQQVLNGYGSKAAFAWLQVPSRAAKVITVHELDSDQTDFPETNKNYNRADAVIVHCGEMKERLVKYGVQREKVHVILHGAEVRPVPFGQKREGIVFYAGHKVMSGKGIETVFKAMAIIRERRPGEATDLRIHGHYGTETPKEAVQLAKDMGVADRVAWLNQIGEDEVVRLYQRSQVCVLPYSGSFAGLAASLAAACQLPVVGTRKAGLPDHLGDTGIWVDENNPLQLAERVLELLDNEELHQQVGNRLLKRAEQALSWRIVAGQTLQIYEQILQQRQAVKGTRALSEVSAPSVVA